MRSVNLVVLCGLVGRDPELRHSQNGNAIVNLSVATNDRYKVGDEWKDRTEWHRVVVFGKSAEYLATAVGKGTMVVVEGRLQTRKWTDKQGVERYTTEIVGMNVIVGGDKPTREHDTPPVAQEAFGGPDDDLPF
jgi:single-strand DNA-binding protein